jgi:hypothetical protein
MLFCPSLFTFPCNTTVIANISIFHIFWIEFEVDNITVNYRFSFSASSTSTTSTSTTSTTSTTRSRYTPTPCITTPFLLAGVSLIIASALGKDVMSGISVLYNILNTLLAVFVPSTIVVAIKHVFSLARN